MRRLPRRHVIEKDEYQLPGLTGWLRRVFGGKRGKVVSEAITTSAKVAAMSQGDAESIVGPESEQQKADDAAKDLRDDADAAAEAYDLLSSDKAGDAACHFAESAAAFLGKDGAPGTKEASMGSDGVRGIGGWLLVYLLLSIPPLMVYSMGLSGWFLEYPFWLMVIIFAVFAMPLVMILRKSRAAPRWNIVMIWAAALLMFGRALGVIFFDPGGPMSWDEAQGVIPILGLIVTVATVWAIVWTLYFRHSKRVRNTFA